MRSANGQDSIFQGFDSLNYTPVPDVLFDELMPQLSHAELRILLYIMRRTFGFKRRSDNISLKQMVEGITTKDGRQLDRGAGLAKSSAAVAIKGLVEKGIVIAERNRSREKGDEPTTYSLRFKQTVEASVSENWTRGGGPENGHARVQNSDTQETGRQETDFDLSNFERSHDQRKATTHESPGAAATTTNLTEHDDQRALGSGRERPMPLGELLRLRVHAAAIGDREPPSAVAAVPANRPATPRRKQPPPGTPEEREALAAYLADFARELGDAAPLSSTITRVVTLFQTTQLPPDQWGDVLYQARVITQERTAQIRTLAADGEQSLRRKNKMPYFLAVLADLLGLEPESPTAGPP